jgi:predicted nucleic acid-binding protein
MRRIESSISVSSTRLSEVLLFDNSAWARLGSARLSQDRRDTVASWIESDHLASCLPFLLEAGYSARSGSDHIAMFEMLNSLPRIAVDAEVESLALAAQRELALVGHHRLPPSDLLIAACAHQAQAGVLHYDRDFDVIAQRTSLDFESEWLAPPGTLD